LAEVARAGPHPVATGERLTTRAEFGALLRARRARSCSPRSAARRHLGGQEDRRAGRSFGAEVAPHLYAGPVEWAANIHLAAAIPNLLMAETIETPFHDALIRGAIRVEDGTSPAPGPRPRDRGRRGARPRASLHRHRPAPRDAGGAQDSDARDDDHDSRRGWRRGAGRRPARTADRRRFHDGRRGEARLGQLLFYDPILSGNRTVSCATCHHPRFATSDGLSLGLGDGGVGLGPDRTADPANLPEQRIPRNSPALFNMGAHEVTVMFHDGRIEADPARPSGLRTPLEDEMVAGFANLLSAQTMFPVLSPDEMAGTTRRTTSRPPSARAGSPARRRLGHHLEAGGGDPRLPRDVRGGLSRDRGGRRGSLHRHLERHRRLRRLRVAQRHQPVRRVLRGEAALPAPARGGSACSTARRAARTAIPARSSPTTASTRWARRSSAPARPNGSRRTSSTSAGCG
jgi:hypothetical protein